MPGLLARAACATPVAVGARPSVVGDEGESMSNDADAVKNLDEPCAKCGPGRCCNIGKKELFWTAVVLALLSLVIFRGHDTEIRNLRSLRSVVECRCVTP